MLGFGVCGKNEKYLEQTLREFQRLCDKTYIVTNNIGHDEKLLLDKYGVEQLEDNRLWGENQWRIKESAVRYLAAQHDDWVLTLDMDEVYDKNFTREEAEKLKKQGGAGYYFYLTNLYENGYAPEWCFWNIRMFPLDIDLAFEQKALHCGLAPRQAYYQGNYAPFIVKHYGLKDKKSRDRKVERYKLFDPKAQFKGQAYYDFLASEYEPKEFNENTLHQVVADEVKDYKFKQKDMSDKHEEYYMVRNPGGKIVDIPARDLSETLAREGFELISKEPIVVGGIGVKTTMPVEKEIEIKEEKVEHTCAECGFIAKSKAGLTAHSKKHGGSDNSKV